MLISARALVTFLAVNILAVSVAHAAEGAYEWLMKINQAARELNYQGTFIYRHGSQIETMVIAHQVKDGAIHERLASQSGAPREVIRDDEEVRCYLPDQNSIVVQHRGARHNAFPALVPDQVATLAENYLIELGSRGRVTGREVQRVMIKPRDDYRYGYQLWADSATGLLLRAEVLSNQGTVLDQFVFTDIAIGGEIPPTALMPRTMNDRMVWYRDKAVAPPADRGELWRVMQLPKGFKLSSRMMRKMPMHGKSAEHLVYSDGLAAVSVYIEKSDVDVAPTMHGPTRMGSLSVYGRPVGDHHVTVVGEVPEKTVAFIGNAIAPRGAP